MSHQNYSLEVISHHPTFKNKPLRKYYVEGIETVGAWGDEPFEVVFKNHSYQKVQVKLSIDGTDVLTGKLASTDITDKMWVVNGYETLSLKAWPETNNGGAQLVFTSGANSVAVHTHGDVSNRGIIAAAVYTESYVRPAFYTDFWNTYYDFDYGRLTMDDYMITCNSASATKGIDSTRSEGLESTAAVGAGQHVDQRITHTTGLVQPSLSEVVRVRYVWWDDLVSKLRAGHGAEPHASGFPADSNKTNINLGSTPRIASISKSSHSAAPVYSRV